MPNLRNVFLLFIVLTLALAACSPTKQAPAAKAARTKAAAAKVTAAAGNSPVPKLRGGKPPQTNASKIIPPERREELLQLSKLLKFKVTGWDGVALGQISDFIINTCETYIIYFTVAPDASLHVESGSQLVIPFEVVTINSGALNAKNKTISIYMTHPQVTAAPVFKDHLPLFPNNWEETVRAYWLQVARVSPLTSECKAGGSDSAHAVHKIAYASELLGAKLKDGNHNLLGTVQEAILEPESGKLGFYVVKLLDGSLIMISLGQTNIPKEALVPGQTIELVLLAEVNKLLGAPRIGSMQDATNAQTQKVAREYWKK